MAARIIDLLCAFLAVTAVLLCGCGGEKSAGVKPELSFTADFTAEYRGLGLKGSLTSLRQGVCSMRFSSPDTLDGLGISFKNGEASLRRGGAEATADEGYLPCNAFPSLLEELLRAAATGDAVKAEDNSYTYNITAGESVLETDENGLPQSAVIPSAEFSVEFSNSKPLE